MENLLNCLLPDWSCFPKWKMKKPNREKVWCVMFEKAINPQVFSLFIQTV